VTDLNITAAQLACLRRIANGEPVGKFRGSLGYLYLHDLVQGASALTRATNTLALTDLGGWVLATHDALTETRKVLASRPLPEGWLRVSRPLTEGWTGTMGTICYNAAFDMFIRSTGTGLPGAGNAEVRARAAATIAILDWFDHEAAVEAQDEVKP